MAHPALCFRVRFRGQNIQSAINLKRVGIHNLGVESLRDFDCEHRFANCGWPYDEENIFHKVGMSLRDVPLSTQLLVTKIGALRRSIPTHKKIGRRARCRVSRLNPIDNQLRTCSADFAPLTTSLRPRNSLSCSSLTARFASSTVCICTKAKPFER